MIRHPAVELEVAPAESFRVAGWHAECARQAAHRWAEWRCSGRVPACRITVRSAPERHVGLGSGTQLALSVAAALDAYRRYPAAAPTELAGLTGRGRRSAVGTYGFCYGGMIVELGKRSHEILAPLSRRVDFPAPWRFVLVRSPKAGGLHGAPERAAFQQLAPVSGEVRQSLVARVKEQILPALQREDFAEFSEGIYHFGFQAGMCFAPLQGGPYNGPENTALVKEIRSLGVRGVGQSSWGPTLFCLLPDQAAAESFAERLHERHVGGDLDIRITAVDNQGARLSGGPVELARD